MASITGFLTTKSEPYGSSSQSCVFTPKKCLVTLGAIAALGLLYLSYSQTDETSQSEPLASSVTPLGESALATVGQVGIYAASFFQMAGMLAAQVGVGAHIQREDRRIDQEKEDDFPLIPEGKNLFSLSDTVTSFYRNHRLEIDKLSWKLSAKNGRLFSRSLHAMGTDELKDWKIVKREPSQVTLAHAELEGLIFRFPRFFQNERLTTLAEKHLKERYLSFYNQLKEWRSLVDSKYSQIVIPETFIMKHHSAPIFLASEAITISPDPIGMYENEALKQFERFKKEIGFLDKDLSWGRNVGFVTSLAGESQSLDEPARIALLDCGSILPFPKG